MLTLTVPLGALAYPIHIGAGALASLGSALGEAGLFGRAALISDENVARAHGAAALDALRSAGLEPEIAAIPPGEASKQVARAEALWTWLIERGFRREHAVVALGGGVVGDLAGFVAATYLRGVPFVQVPTSLLAMVDSSVGGKVGVDHPLGKNLVGAFHQPKLVLIDPATLATLPVRERWSGLGEAVKTALLEGGALLPLLEAELERIATGPPDDACVQMLAACVHYKARVVAADEREGGLRRVLNLGHTFGHALEQATGYTRFTHGEAVALGLRAAVWLSREMIGLPAAEAERALRLVARIAVEPPRDGVDREAVLRAMGRDKKGGRFVLLGHLGEPRVVDGVPPELVARALDEALR
jgi:3-dehydroquinate synthase